MADDKYYNEPVDWVPITGGSTLFAEHIEQLKEHITKRLLVPMPMPSSKIFEMQYEPFPVLGNLRVTEMSLESIKFIGIDFSVDAQPVALERPDAEWNF